MGKDIRRELKLVPASASIVEHVRYVYACRDCEANAYGVPIVKSAIDEPVIKGSFASPEAIAHIMTQKFEMGSPLYRQEKEWDRNGIQLSRQTMSNWLLKSTESWLVPIYDALHELLVLKEVLHADETTLQVLKEPDKPPSSKSYMWLYRTSGDTKYPIVLFDYQPDRSSKRPKKFLKGYSGYLHVDGYAGYHTLPGDITIVGCLAHCRRKYVESLDAIPQKDRTGSLALQGKEYCDKLFDIERALKNCISDERFKKREELARPVLNTFRNWIDQVHPAPKTSIGGAVRYTREQWKYLEAYMLDGRLEISNNRAERSIKPFVIDRKNFLFANTPRGARNTAIMFSIIQTANENGLNAYAYLTQIFKDAPNWDIRNNPDALDLLMPWSAHVQGLCKKPIPETTDVAAGV
jgi:transposase